MSSRASRAWGDVASSSRKRDRGVANIPPATAAPKGQQPRYGVRAVLQHKKRWYKSNNEIKYFLDVPIDVDILSRDFLVIY